MSEPTPLPFVERFNAAVSFVVTLLCVGTGVARVHSGEDWLPWFVASIGWAIAFVRTKGASR